MILKLISRLEIEANNFSSLYYSAEDVNNRDLPALTVEDLELLGVQSSEIRKTFVLEFANTKIKDEHFER